MDKEKEIYIEKNLLDIWLSCCYNNIEYFLETLKEIKTLVTFEMKYHDFEKKYKDFNDATILIIICSYDLPMEKRQIQIEIIKYMIEKIKVNVDAQDERGETALIMGVIMNNDNMPLIRYLVEGAKANINILDNDRRSAMSHACEGLNPLLVEYLICNGAYIDECDRRGNSNLMIAIIHYRIDNMEILMKHGANVHIHNEKDETAKILIKQRCRYKNMKKRFNELLEEMINELPTKPCYEDYYNIKR